jgi:NurA domain
MLDFNQVAVQMAAFARDQADSANVLRAALKEAVARLQNSGPNWTGVQEKIGASHTSWLMPIWRERPDQTFDAPPRLATCTALATDGSQIVADRHDLALCYLVNVGYITLRYGENSSASLRSRPTLAVPDDTLLSDYHGDQDPIAPKRLAMQCRLHEIGGLAELIEEEAGGLTTHLNIVAFCDGSLILWPLETERDEIYRRSVLNIFQAYLDIGRAHGVPFAGYISKPMSKDIVNSLRVSACPFDTADCDRNCPKNSLPKPEYVEPACAGTERVTDADLFAGLLRAGQRSAVFCSGSKILREYEARHRIAFFYMHTGREVARVEIPAWVADDPVLLALTHTLCYDQALKGDGYPVALAEAHEQAIVRGAERSAFFHLMERHFVTDGLPVGTTQKALAKRARRV